MTVVTLTSGELLAASATGAMRRISSLAKARVPGHGIDSCGWSEDIEGACGELAAAKALDRYWNAPINNFKGGDVGVYQVRTTSREDGRLIIRQDDDPDAVFILVTGRAPTFNVHGYITAAAAQQAQWLQNPNGREPAWFVPQTSLRPIEELA